jgi:Acyl-protein synthetase, LuxE
MTIAQDVLDFIASPLQSRFSALAVKVFRHQFDAVPSYRAYCESRGANPERVASIDDIPAVSPAAFKYADLSQRGDGARLEFLTSGTTLGRDRRGRHVLWYPEVYRASAIAHLKSMLFRDGARPRMLAMHPGSDMMPESSLSTMISWCIDQFGAGERLYAANRQGVDLEAAVKFLRQSKTANAAVCILTTTAAFAALCAHLEGESDRIALPAGSRMMDTGGIKGQVIPLNPGEVVAHAGKCLGIEPDLVINEYGMTELCSQLYDATAFNSRDAMPAGERVKIAPPWLAVRAIDPATLSRVPDGETGLLAFFDLANVGSVSAVMTEDLGIVEGNRVRVLGRAATSDARGCALAIGEFEAAEVNRSHHDAAGLVR